MHHSEAVFADCRRIVLSAVEVACGRLWEDQGESFPFVFQRAKDAVVAAVSAQRARSCGQRTVDLFWLEHDGQDVYLAVHLGTDEKGRHLGAKRRGSRGRSTVCRLEAKDA